jgi:SAM-dependent methyltransferase
MTRPNRSWSDNDAVAALRDSAQALEQLASIVPDRHEPAQVAARLADDPMLPLQNLPAHVMFARHWETHRVALLGQLTARPCPLCGGHDRSTWFHTQDGYRYDICAVCGMVHAPEVLPMPVWDAYYASLPQARESLRQQMVTSVEDAALERDRTRFGRYLSLLREHGAAEPGARLLDLGSFTGGALHVASEYGLDAFGVEGLAEAVRFTRDRFPHLRLEQAHTERLDPDVFGGRFDIVTMWETLEHTFDPIESLRLAARALRPGGWLALSVPNARNVQFSVLGQFCFYAYGGYQGTGHINMFSPVTLTRALQTAGLEPVHLSTEFGTDWRQVLYYLRQQFDRIHCYARLVRLGEVSDPGAEELAILLNWLSPALTRLENACLAGPIAIALARRPG